MRKNKSLPLLLLGFAVVLSSVLIPTPNVSAAVDDAYGGNGIRNVTDARNYLNSYCANNDTPVAVAAYPTDVNFNDTTGAMTYTANVVWRSCGKVDDTRAFAVTGYPSNAYGGIATCPDAGTYGNPESATYWPTYDCVKYTGSDSGHLNGYATLGCYEGRGSGYGCTSGLFPSVVENMDKQPNNSYDGNYRAITGMGGQVPDWSNRTQGSGDYTFTRSDAFCTFFKYNRTGANGSGNCIGLTIKVSWVRLNFNLTPTISVTPSTVESGTPVTATPNVNNTGTTQSSAAQWQVTRFRVNPGLPVPGAAQNGTVPVSYYANGAAIINQGTTTFPRNNTALAAANENIGDLPPGTRVCFALSVQPMTQSDSRWNHSTPACVTVAKKPKVQILGGDLIVGRGSAYNPARVSQVATSSSFSTSTNRYYGSWSEYAIIPSGTVRGMASGALYVDGATSSDLCTLSLLTLSNNNGTSCQSGSIGNYTYGSTAPNVATRFPVTSNIAGTSVDIRTLTSGQTYSVSSNSLNISSTQPIPGGNGTTKGKWVVINDPDATVTITSNINYADTPINQIDDIPQVVIIARNILIADTVTNVDAWLIATGTGTEGIINTCSAIAAGAPTTLNSNRCNNSTPLTINGPVLANHLYLYRTTGSGAGAAGGAPAEIFNLRADAYVWASAYSPGNGRIPTVSTKELPPRF